MTTKKEGISFEEPRRGEHQGIDSDEREEDIHERYP
jgi:hypothetical protein